MHSRYCIKNRLVIRPPVSAGQWDKFIPRHKMRSCLFHFGDLRFLSKVTNQSLHVVTLHQQPLGSWLERFNFLFPTSMSSGEEVPWFPARNGWWNFHHLQSYGNRLSYRVACRTSSRVLIFPLLHLPSHTKNAVSLNQPPPFLLFHVCVFQLTKAEQASNALPLQKRCGND